MLNVSTNCLICSYCTHKHCQAGLESGYAVLGGTYKGFYRKHIVCPYGLVEMQLGEDLTTCQAERLAESQNSG